MQRIRTSHWLFAAGTLGLLGPAHALEPGSIGEGALKLTPTIQISTTRDDNIRADESEDSSWVTSLGPQFQLDLDQGNAVHSLVLGITRELVHSYSSENSTTWSLALDSVTEFDVRNRLLVEAYARDTSGITAEGDPSDEYRNRGVSLGYGFGARGAFINADATVGADQVRSRNSANLDKELDAFTVTGTLYVSVSPDTQVLGEVRRRATAYETNTDLDNTSLSYLLGARWEATAFTSGSLRVGRQEKDFDEAGEPDDKSNVWEVGVTWAPLTYSSVGLRTSRSLEEGDEGSTSLRRSIYGVDWNHEWSPRLSTLFSLSETRERHDTGRNDKTRNYSGTVTYNLMRQLDIGARAVIVDKNSTLASEAYDRNQFGIFLVLGI